MIKRERVNSKKFLKEIGEEKEYFLKTMKELEAEFIEKSLEFGEIDTNLNFKPLTESQMIEKSKFALEDYRKEGSRVAHHRVREWAKNLGNYE